MTQAVVIRGGLLLDAPRRLAEPRDILVIAGAIAEIGAPGLAAPADAVVFDAAGTLMHPGLVNGHTHGIGNFMKGRADRWTLELLLNGSGELFGNQAREDKYLNTYLGAVEMVLKGCTTCYDLSFGTPLASPEDLVAVGQAYLDAGMRAVIAPMLADVRFYQAIPGLFEALPAPLQAAVTATDPAGAEGILAIMRQALQSWPHSRDRVRLGLAPTIPLLCSDALIIGSARLARDYGTVLQSHVAESKVQAVSALKRWGKSLTAHIDALGLLGPDFSVAHGVWLDDDDMRRLADHGCTVSHNPGSNMRLGCGIADARRMLELGVTVAIGTDGACCADNQNMYEAMRYASMVSNVRGPDYHRWLTTPEIIAAATTGGARATGFDRIGAIAPGYRADIVFLDLKSINWIPMNDPANQIVLTEDSTGVIHVMVDGELVVQNRRHRSADLTDLAGRVAATHARLVELNGPARAQQLQLADLVGHFCIGLSRTPHHIERYAAPYAQ
jgi:5-methylthioadenosine/S-adenosylhomocysteine deaminase